MQQKGHIAWLVKNDPLSVLGISTIAFCIFWFLIRDPSARLHCLTCHHLIVQATQMRSAVQAKAEKPRPAPSHYLHDAAGRKLQNARQPAHSDSPHTATART